MPSYNAVTLVVFLVFISNYVLTKDCNLSPRKETEDKQPIFLNNSAAPIYTFIIPKNGSVLLGDGETLVISCPNPNNYLQHSNVDVTEGICRNGRIKSADKYLGLDAIQCNKSVRADVRLSGEKCGSGEGVLTRIGYALGTQFLTLIEVCYDGVNGNTLFAEHTIHGDSIRNASRSNIRPGFSTAGVAPKVSAAVSYKRPFQKSTFNKLLGSSASADLYINRKSYLSRGHLAPDADFHFAAWQFSTYFYINTCPQWQVINGGNWQKIEKMVRRAAGNLKTNLRVVTGSHGVLQLPDVNGTMQDLYLVSGNKLPVPKYFWKIVFDPNSSNGIVLINLNNPFVGELKSSEFFCDSICVEQGWGNNDWNVRDKGLVHCCEYKTFAKSVRTVPSLNTKGILKGPYKN